jgi:hypothetical protein
MNIENDYSLEEKLDCKEQMNLVEKSFNAFLKEKNAIVSKKPETLLKQIRDYLFSRNKERIKLLENTRLKKSDCITLSIITQMLAKRKGLTTKIAHPTKITHYLHALILYKKNGKTKKFEIASSKISKNVKELNQKQLLRRFKLTRPFISTKREIKRKKTIK